MNTGLLVERAQIKDEMQKLAAGLVEEERRRGSAEERRIKVENEVDDLAASLFNQVSVSRGRIADSRRIRWWLSSGYTGPMPRLDSRRRRRTSLRQSLQ